MQIELDSSQFKEGDLVVALRPPNTGAYGVVLRTYTIKTSRAIVNAITRNCPTSPSLDKSAIVTCQQVWVLINSKETCFINVDLAHAGSPALD